MNGGAWLLRAKEGGCILVGLAMPYVLVDVVLMMAATLVGDPEAEVGD